MKTQQFNRMIQKGLESTLTLIGDIIPVSIGIKNPVIFMEHMEKFLEKSSLKLEAFVEGKLQRNHKKDIIRQKISKSPILPPHSVRTEESLEKVLSKEDILKRLAEIDRIIITRELQQEIEH